MSLYLLRLFLPLLALGLGLDPAMEEIYTIVNIAHKNGQEAVPVHIFPFPMNDENMMARAYSPWRNFWQNLQTGYDYFEITRRPPSVLHQGGRYIFRASSS